METFSSQGSNQSLGANKLELVSTNRSSSSEKHQRLEVEPNQKAITATHTKSERSTEGPPAQKAIPRSVSYSLPRREWNTTLAGNNGKLALFVFDPTQYSIRNQPQSLSKRYSHESLFLSQITPKDWIQQKTYKPQHTFPAYAKLFPCPIFEVDLEPCNKN